MNFTLNTRYLAAQLKKATQLARAGLIMIVLTMGLSIAMFSNQDYYWLVFLAYPTLIIGFPLRQYGTGLARAWKVAGKVPELLAEEIRPTLKQHLFGFVPVGDQVIHDLLVSTEGLLVIEMRGLTETEKGTFEVTCRQKDGQDRWSQRLPILERFARLGEPRLGNPSLALDAKIAALKAWLAERGMTDVPVRGVVVFRQSATPLNIEACTYEVLHLNELRSFLSLGQYFDEDMRTTVLPGDERNRIMAGIRGLLGVEGAPAPVAAPKAKAPVRKLSPEARAEQQRVREIRAARAAEAAAAAAKQKPAPTRAGRPADTGAPTAARPGPGSPRKGA